MSETDDSAQEGGKSAAKEAKGKPAKKAGKKAAKRARKTTKRPAANARAKRRQVKASKKRARGVKEVVRKINGEPAKKRGPKTRPWSEKDHRIASLLVDAGESPQTVANALKRSRENVIYELGEEAFANRSIQRRAGGQSKRHLTQKEESQILQMAAYGIPYADIAECLDCTEEFLIKRMGAKMKAAKTKAVALVAGFLVDQARRGSTPAAKFFLTVQGGWRETKRVEVDHAAGVLVAAPSAPTAEDWIAKHAKKVDAEVRNANGRDRIVGDEREEDEDDDGDDDR